jgi:iron complex outermembrane receptor protein
MVFRRLYLRLPACTASPASSSFPTYFQDDTQQTFKINVFIFAINCILAGLTGIAVLLPGPVLAAESLGSAASQEYAIPAGRLSDVLAQFAATSGVQLVFDPAMLADLRSNGLQGRYTVQEGFLLLLANSGYELVDTGGGSYSLRKAPAVGNPSGEAVVLPLMTVSASTVATDGTAADGYRSRKVSQVGPWQGRELDDLPYSMTVLPAELLENVRGATVDQIFRINPTTQIGRLQVDNNQPNVLMRGFNNQSFYRDGLAGSRYNHDVGLENTERVEVLSGLSGFLYGPGNVGGIVNFITKRPTAERLNRLTARYNGGTNFHVHGDFGGPIDRDGRFGYRINAAYQDGELAVDRAKLRRTFLSAAFDWRVTDDLLLQAHVSDGDFLLTGAQTGFSLATGVRRPSARDIDNTRSWGPPGSERYYKTTSYGANLRWEASDWLTLRAGWRENDSKRYQQFVNNTFQADGTYTQSYNSYGFGPDRNYYEVQEERLYQVFADIRFDTGTISHTLSGGIQRTHHWNEYPTSDMWQPQVTILTGARLENGPIYIPRPVFDPFVPHESIPTFTRGSMTLNLGDDIHLSSG